MQAGLITSSVKPAEKKRQQTAASGMIKYFFDYKDWFTVAVGLPDFCSVSDWKQGQNYLRIALKTLSDQGLLIYANARELPSQLAIQPPPQTGPESTPKPTHSNQVKVNSLYHVTFPLLYYSIDINLKTRTNKYSCGGLNRK